MNFAKSFIFALSSFVLLDMLITFMVVSSQHSKATSFAQMDAQAQEESASLSMSYVFQGLSLSNNDWPTQDQSLVELFAQEYVTEVDFVSTKLPVQFFHEKELEDFRDYYAKEVAMINKGLFKELSPTKIYKHASLKSLHPDQDVHDPVLQARCQRIYNRSFWLRRILDAVKSGHGMKEVSSDLREWSNMYSDLFREFTQRPSNGHSEVPDVFFEALFYYYSYIGMIDDPKILFLLKRCQVTPNDLVKIAVELYPQNNLSKHADFAKLTQRQKLVWNLVAEVYQKNTGILPDRIRQVFELVKATYIQCMRAPNAASHARTTLDYVLNGNENEVGLLDLFTKDRSYFSQWFMTVLTDSEHEPKVAYYLAHYAVPPSDFVADIIEVTLFSFSQQFIAKVKVDGHPAKVEHPAVRFLALMYTATVKVFKNCTNLYKGSDVLDASFIAKKSKYSPKTPEAFDRSPVQQIMFVELAKKNHIGEVASTLQETWVLMTKQQFIYKLYKHIMSATHWTVIPDFVKLLVLDQDDFDFSSWTTNEWVTLKLDVLDPIEKALGDTYLQVFTNKKLAHNVLIYMFDMCVQVAVLKNDFNPLLQLVHGRLNAVEHLSAIGKKSSPEYQKERHLYEGSGNLGSRVKSVRNFIQQSLFDRKSDNDIMLWKQTLRNAIVHATKILYKPGKIRPKMSNDKINSHKQQAQNFTALKLNNILRRFLAEQDKDWPNAPEDSEERNAEFMAQLMGQGSENDSI